MINGFIRGQIVDSYTIKKKILEDEILLDVIQRATEKAIDVYRNGGKTLIAGNGGSAADAQHMAGEFVSRFYFDRPGMPSLALSTDTSVLTAIGNDYGYDQVFSRQIEANGNEGDMFIGISTSGNSKNIINAVAACKSKNIITVVLTGQDGGALDGACDYCIKVPSTVTPRIQESHTLIGHIICSAVEEAIFGKGFV